MKEFIFVCTFLENTTSEQIKELIPAEQVAAKILEDQGAIGKIRVAGPKRTVFIEAYAESEELAKSNILSLPLAKLWNIEVFETTPPAGVNTNI